MRPPSIDLLIFTSQTRDYQIPATACVLHERSGLRVNCGCFDVNQGCSAFPYSLGIANGLLETGAAERAFVLNADTITQVLYSKDRALVTLHGDAAVATLVDRSPGGGRLHGFHYGTDGTGWKQIVMPVSGARTPRTAETGREIVTETGSVTTAEHLQMNGPAVFHFTMTTVPEAIQFALAKWHWTVEDCRLSCCTRPNKTMVDMIYRALNVPEEKRFYFLEQVGNAAGASSPMLLAEALRQGKVQPGDKLVLSGFGNGLSWSAVAIEWS